MLEKNHLEILRKEFEDSVVGVKVQSVSKNKDRALLVLYLQHTDVMNRLEEVDPSWSFIVLNERREAVKDRFGKESFTVYAKGELTVLGVTRENVGEGDDPKAAYSDCLKRCAMSFGVGRSLYDQEMVWVPYDEERDRFKQWTIQEYRQYTKTATVKSKKSDQLPKENQTSSSKQSATQESRSLPTEDQSRSSLQKTCGQKELEELKKHASLTGWTLDETGVRGLLKAYGFDKLSQVPLDLLTDIKAHMTNGGLDRAVSLVSSWQPPHSQAMQS